MAVRARRLFGPIATAEGGATIVLYTVPAGRTAILRTLAASNFETDATTLFVVWLNFIDGTEQLWRVPSLGAGSTLVFPGQVVLNPGDVLSARTDPSTGQCAFSGFGSLLFGAPE